MYFDILRRKRKWKYSFSEVKKVFRALISEKIKYLKNRKECSGFENRWRCGKEKI
jgi:hypothetical protein